MKVVFVIMLFVCSFAAKAQSRIDMFLDSTLKELKTQGKVDETDLKVFVLLDRFYNEALQSDKGELTRETVGQINEYVAKAKAKNRHLLILFLMYQEYISSTAAQGNRADPNYQLAIINLLEREVTSIYDKVPIIVNIYKAEALQSAGLKNEAKDLIANTLKQYPNSIPMKVYRFLDTNDEGIKTDLLQHHSGHWMVQQFKIK